MDAITLSSGEKISIVNEVGDRADKILRITGEDHDDLYLLTYDDMDKLYRLMSCHQREQRVESI